MNQICIQWPLYSSLVRPCQRHSSRVWVCKEGHMPPPFLKAEFLSWQEKMFGWARGLRISLEVKIPLFFFFFFFYICLLQFWKLAPPFWSSPEACPFPTFQSTTTSLHAILHTWGTYLLPDLGASYVPMSSNTTIWYWTWRNKSKLKWMKRAIPNEI